MTPFLCINPNSNELATLGRFAHYRVRGSGIVRITAMPQYPFVPERFVIAGPPDQTRNWMIHDIEIGLPASIRSQFAQSGDLPGDMFATTAIDSFLSLEAMPFGSEVVVSVSNIGDVQMTFIGGFLGRNPNSGARMMLPINSGIEIEPGFGDTSEGEPCGHHVIIELDDRLYHVTFNKHWVVMLETTADKLSASALEEIDTNLDRRGPSVVTIRTLTLASGVDAELANTPNMREIMTGIPFPYGFVLFDEASGLPILTVGDVCRDGTVVEWHPEGYQPEWLADPLEDA